MRENFELEGLNQIVGSVENLNLQCALEQEPEDIVDNPINSALLSDEERARALMEIGVLSQQD